MFGIGTWVKVMENYSHYPFDTVQLSLYPILVMASCLVKFSSGKIVPHSNLPVGTTREELIIHFAFTSANEMF